MVTGMREKEGGRAGGAWGMEGGRWGEEEEEREGGKDRLVEQQFCSSIGIQQSNNQARKQVMQAMSKPCFSTLNIQTLNPQPSNRQPSTPKQAKGGGGGERERPCMVARLVSRRSCPCLRFSETTLLPASKGLRRLAGGGLSAALSAITSFSSIPEPPATPPPCQSAFHRTPRTL
jgi:hypothetical protein